MQSFNDLDPADAGWSWVPYGEKIHRYDDGSEVAERRKNPDNEGIVDAQANVRTVQGGNNDQAFHGISQEEGRGKA